MQKPSNRSSFIAPILEALDPLVRSQVEQALTREGPRTLAPSKRWVLAGHRSAGKSTILPHLAKLAGKRAVDLDQEIERRTGKTVRELFEASSAGFRQEEREAFAATEPGSLVAVGGGFLFHHRDLLGDDEVILVPITFETYCARLSQDRSRPRLRPDLPLEEELRAVFFEREAVHRATRTVSLAQALASCGRDG